MKAIANEDPGPGSKGDPRPGPGAPSAYEPPAILFVERLEAQASTCSPPPYAKGVVTLTDCTQVTSS